MNAVVQIILLLCLVIGGLAMMYRCTNVGNDVLSSCRSNPNIRIEKRDDRSYRLSLHRQNTWWTAGNDKWIECKHLCDVCESLPGINKGENIWSVGI